MAKHEAANRPRKEAHGEGAEGGDGAGERIELGKKSLLNTSAAAVP